MSTHHSDQMSQRSLFDAVCISKSKTPCLYVGSDRGRYRAVSDTVWTAKKGIANILIHRLIVRYSEPFSIIYEVEWNNLKLRSKCGVRLRNREAGGTMGT